MVEQILSVNEAIDVEEDCLQFGVPCFSELVSETHCLVRYDKEMLNRKLTPLLY